MRNSSRFGIALLALGTVAVSAASAAELPLSLREAVDRALQRNEALAIERESAGAARAAVRAARGAYDPRLQIIGAWSEANVPVNAAPAGPNRSDAAPETRSREGTVSLAQTLPTGGELGVRASGGRTRTESPFAALSPAWGSSAGLELRQPLLRDLTIDPVRLSSRVAAANHRGADALFRRTLSETVAAVSQAYWGLVAARRGVEVRTEALRLADEQLEETGHRVASGLSPQTELAQPRAERERRHSELLGAREAASRAQNTLKLLILADEDEAAWSASLVPTDSVSVDGDSPEASAALERAFRTRPELTAFEAFLDRREVESRFARDRRWPRLDAVVSYDRFGLAGRAHPAGSGGTLAPGLAGDFGDALGQLGDGDYEAARFALVLELPVFQRTARAEAEAAGSRERQAGAELTRARKTVRAEVLDATAALETARQRIAATRAGREAAEIQLAAEEDRFENGLSTNFLVLTRQNDLSRARLDEISALTDFGRARTELARATGTLAEEYAPGRSAAER